MFLKLVLQADLVDKLVNLLHTLKFYTYLENYHPK